MARSEQIVTDIKFCSSCRKWTTHTVGMKLIVCTICGANTKKGVILPIRWRNGLCQ